MYLRLSNILDIIDANPDLSEDCVIFVEAFDELLARKYKWKTKKVYDKDQTYIGEFAEGFSAFEKDGNIYIKMFL